jgi:hypothetical protein
MDQRTPHCNSFHKRPYADLPIKSAFACLIEEWSSYGGKEHHLEDVTLASYRPLRHWYTWHNVQVQLRFSQEKPFFVRVH